MKAVAIAGIAIGAATLLIAISIVSGFQREYRRSILDFNAHVVILRAGEMEDISGPLRFTAGLENTKEEKQFEQSFGWMLPYWNAISSIYRGLIDFHDDISYKFEMHPDFVAFWEKLDPRRIAEWLPDNAHDSVNQISKMGRKGLVGATPFLYREGLIISGGIIKGVVIKGVDWKTVRDVNQMSIQLPQGVSLEEALSTDDKIPKIILGKALAQRIGISTAPSPLRQGDGGQAREGTEGWGDKKVTLMVPKTGREKNFISVVVSGIFESGLYDYDSQFALMSIEETRRVFEAGPIRATGIEIKLDDPQKAKAVADIINDELGAPYQTLTWGELNRDLFEALLLEKLVFSIIMGILVVVAAFNIIGVLVLLISYRAHEVAILKALGMPTNALRKIFTRGGVATGLVGTITGLAVGLALASSLKHYQFIRLEPEIYFLSSLPIDISWSICGMILLFSLLMCYVTSRMAAKRLAQLPISEALKI